MRTARRWALIAIFILFLMGLRPTQAAIARPAQQSATLSWTGPLACPPSGCAGGQTLSLRFFFTPQNLVPATPNPDPKILSNLMVCLFAPSNWIDTTKNTGTADSAYVSSNGINTGQVYTRVLDNTVCNGLAERPAGMISILEATANLPLDTSSDALEFAFRLSPRATWINGVTAKMLVKAADGTWAVQQSDATSTLQAYDPGASLTLAYVANDAAGCGFYQPFYLNSGVDLQTGIGTGLKDAVDILQPPATGGPATINLLGAYTVKGNTVQVNKAVKLTALGSASLTYNDLQSCDQPLISLEDAVTLSGLTINDGGCNGHRNLVRVASAKAVQIQSNTLTGGNDAIVIDQTTTGPVTVRFNQITGNTGKSVSYLGDGTQGGPLYVTANNLTAVQCAAGTGGLTSAPRFVNHNFWANGLPDVANHNFWANGLPDVASVRCSIDPAKRLGLPIAAPATGPGVNAVTALVKAGDETSATSVMNGQVLFYHHAGDPDFPIYVVDHGFLTAGGAPFSGGASFNAPMPCSNYWDVFLDESVDPTKVQSSTLELLMRYGKGSQDQCVTTINSSKFCDQTTTQSLYPLYWLDPSALSSGWKTTGASGGQVTACDTGKQLIQVSIDNEGHPNLTGNLGYTPLMVGLPVLNYFRASASNNLVTITWATNVEPNISGFYLLRGTDPNHLSAISGLIDNQGSLSTGYYYPAIYDTNRTNGTTYYYQLQIVRSDGSVFYSNLQSTTGTSATATATPTPTITPVTPTWTPYPTSTPQPTYIPTRVPTLYVPYRSPTAPLNTLTPSPTFPLLDTLTGTPDLGTPGAADTLTAIAISGGGTATNSPTPESATPSVTTSVTPAPAAVAATDHPWLSLLFGLLAGTAAAAGAGGLFYYLRLRSS